jgi:hypothetical protein
MTEEKLDEIGGKFGGAGDSFEELIEEEDEESLPRSSPREELERRLADARARRRSPADLEEPLA